MFGSMGEEEEFRFPEQHPKLSKIAQEVLEKREQQRRTLANQLFILHSIFEKFKRDDDDNYGISVVELFPMMEKLGLKLEREKLEDLVVKYDPEGTHFIRPEIFATLLLEHMLIFDDQKAEVLNAFKVFDEMETGFIESGKLRHIMQNMGDTLSDEEVNRFIKQSDIDRDGMVNYEEFTKVMCKDIISEDHMS